MIQEKMYYLTVMTLGIFQILYASELKHSEKIFHHLLMFLGILNVVMGLMCVVANLFGGK